MSEAKKYSIVVAGRSYPLLVSKAEETILNNLEADISASINKMQIQYQHLDKQDCLSMTLIQMALDNNKEGDEIDTSNKLTDQVEAIEKLLALV